VRLVLVLLLAALVVAAPAYAAPRVVKVGDNWFVRPGNANVTVKKGKRVVWRNVGNSPHTVTVRRGPVKFNRRLAPGQRFARKMTRPGTYRIICSFHAGQRMRLRVRR
jgi:plastocyanin